MYLKKIEMRGFKSFADKTEVVFENGVTCVVGPNGSGKSNITDAVRWVLGEQRVKTLRGSKMEDVIFNGTKHRKALGLAEVTLTFDNSEGFFPLDFNEISVVRKVHRSGESEYLINQMPCRLKDIRELFMDTGIGREGYSIIGQGRIDEVLSNNKDERRLLFEEAAGIVKFKGRKQETERKLKTTAENMLRVKDILSEIEDRVEPLRKESERAKKYLDLTELLKRIEVHAFQKRYTECEQGLVQFLEGKEKLEDELTAIQSRRSRRQETYNEKDRMLYEQNVSLRQLEEKRHTLLNQESRYDGEKQVVLEKMANAKGNIQRLDEEIRQVDGDRRALEEAVETIREEESACASALAEQKTAYEAALAEKDTALKALNALRQNNASDREEANRLSGLIEVKSKEIDTINAFLVQYENRMTPLKEDLASAHQLLQDKEAVKSELAGHMAREREALDTANQKLKGLLASNEQYGEKKRHLTASLEKQTLEQGKVSTEIELLKSLEEDYEGYDKGVKEVLKSLGNQSGIHGILASLIHVEEAYEVAIEVALGRAVQNIVCDTVAQAKTCIEFLRKKKLGRVTFQPLEHFEGRKTKRHKSEEAFKQSKGWIGFGTELLDYDAQYEGLMDSLLGRIVIVETFDDAAQLIKQKGFQYKVVTLKGDVLVPKGPITGGSFRSKVSNLLGRKRQIETLEERARVLETEVTSSKIELEQTARLLEDNSEALKTIRAELDGLRMEVLRYENRLENEAAAYEKEQGRVEKLEREIEVLTSEREQAQEQIEEKRRDIDCANEKLNALQEQLAAVVGDIEALETRIDTTGEHSTSLQIQMASAEQNLTFKKRERLRLEDDLKRLDEKRLLRCTQLDDLEKQQAAFDSKAQAIEGSIRTLKASIVDLEGELNDKIKEKQSFSSEIKALTQEMTQLSSAYDAAKERLHKTEVKLAKLEVEKEAVVSELWDKYEMSMGEAMLSDDEPPKADLKKLKLDIKLMGTVNLSAIEEYEDVSERHRFLVEQKEDLSASIEQLEKIIRDLDKKMEALFKTHFESINDHFKETFKLLFNGGDAELVLTDYDDLLNCDVDIIAQPPGKKLQSINLLSGGEKALTAIALLFAILKTKPSPFCILDEIEAALDDVNVYRFAEFIQLYARHSQFVVITHRKGTMEVADTLYGVTMEEYGVSKVLSVKLEDIEDKFN